MLAVEVTGSDIGDAPLLPELLAQIPADQDIAGVTADGAYDTRKCHDANAVIPPRKNAKTWRAITAGAVARNEAQKHRSKPAGGGCRRKVAPGPMSKVPQPSTMIIDWAGDFSSRYQQVS